MGARERYSMRERERGNMPADIIRVGRRAV